MSYSICVQTENIKIIVGQYVEDSVVVTDIQTIMRRTYHSLVWPATQTTYIVDDFIHNLSREILENDT